MSAGSFSVTRTSTISTGNQLLSTLRRTQRSMLDLQNQISTGKRLNKPSDDPSRTSSVLFLESQIESRGQYERNLDHALGTLNTTDAALNDISDILLESKSIASSQVGIGSDPATRKAEAEIIDSQIRALIDIANRQYQGVSIFGGTDGAARGQNVYESFLGGIRYTGSREDLLSDSGGGGPLGFNINGQNAFRSLSSRVVSRVDLDLQGSPETRINSLVGAQGLPVRLGTVGVVVDGQQQVVDLAGAQTMEDIVIRIQNAIDTLSPGSGAFTINGAGFRLDASVDIQIQDIANGQTAKDLGIEISADNAIVDGADVGPRLTSRTLLSSLGIAIDFDSGLKITQGEVTRVADFSDSVTIEDMVNEIEQLGLGLRLEINSSQSSLNLISEVSGIELSIGENMGSTAQDLGLRTFGTQTRLADFRLGLGVETVVGEDDFSISLADGTTFNVNLDGVTDVGETLDAITAAAQAAGLAVGGSGDTGTQFNVGLAMEGNGFYFEDGTTGSENFRIQQLGLSLAATHLGIYKDVGSETILAGDDQTRVRAESIFTNLIDLRDGLRNDDQTGITIAGGKMDTDLEQVARIRAEVGTRARRTEQQIERSIGLKISEQTLLSEIQDTELTEAITRFLQLQQQLEASLSVGSTALQQSLLDFLR